MKKIVIFIVIVIFIFASFLYYYNYSLKPINAKDTSTKIFVVKKGEGVTSVINKLQQENLIRSRIAFYILVKQLDIEVNIQAGDFRLSPSMSSTDIAQNLTKGTLDVWITIIEGMRKEEIAQILSKELSIPETEFIKQAPEGYLFPDTYLVPKDATIDTILQIFSRNFESKYSEELQKKAEALGLSNDQVIILASIVEREARSEESRKQVASILLKRYQQGWGLNADATLQYALSYQSNDKVWWKKYLTDKDKLIDSPYNTYKYKGFPPGPICNPSLSSIKAVAEAEPSTPYWFYLTSADGLTMHYAKTYEEHNENIAKFLH